MITKIGQKGTNKLGILILTITASLSQFVVYRYIFQSLGKEQMGLWSIVVASTSLGLISNFGLSNGLIRYVAQFNGKKDDASINSYIATANAVNLLFSLPIIALLYFPSKYYGASVLTTLQFESFSKILPWSLLSIYLNNLSSSYICLLDGFQSFFTRSIIQSIGFIVFGIFAIILASYSGLLGISLALCIQSIFVFICSLFIVNKRKYLPFVFPVYFESKAFKSLIGYGVKFQLITILVFLFDPIIKFCLTKLFGLSVTGVYELANKVLIQFRNIVVNLNQVITPAVASISDKREINLYLQTSFKSNYWKAVNISIFALCCMPLASYFFTGTIDLLYFNAYIFLSFGWLANIVCSPFYYSFLGIDKLFYPIIEHCLHALVPIVIFFLFSDYLPLNLSFLLPSIALFSGSIYLIYAGKIYYKLNEVFAIITKEKVIYLYLGLLLSLLLDQLFFAGNYYFIIIAAAMLFWLIYLCSLAGFTPLIQKLLLKKEIEND